MHDLQTMDKVGSEPTVNEICVTHTRTHGHGHNEEMRTMRTENKVEFFILTTFVLPELYSSK